MKAHLILDEKISKKTIERINKIDSESLIILSEKSIYYNLIKQEPERKIELLDISSTAFSKEKVQITNHIVNSLLDKQPSLLWEGLKLPYLTINTIFDNFTNIIYNVILGLSDLTAKYHIDRLYLYEGNPNYQFQAITFSEGERAFRFLYRRSWYLNYFIKEAFEPKLEIIWQDRSIPILMKSVFNLRINTIFTLKVFMIFKRFILRKLNSGSKVKSVSNGDASNNTLYAILPVRNPIQVEPLLPVYNYLASEGEPTPIYLAYENYSNKKLCNVLEKNNVRYFDMYNLMTLSRIYKSIKDYYSTARNNQAEKSIEFKVMGFKLNLSKDKLIKEAAVMWFDVFLFKKTLDDACASRFKNVKYLISNETYGYYGALEGEWARTRGIQSYGIQHVAISESLKPKISWVDNTYVLSKEVADNLTKLETNEKFTYVGPIAYDLYFNKTKHKDQFESIIIFTGPDDFKKDYIEIIDDVIDIIIKNKLDIMIILKLHPREKDIASFNNFKKKYENIKIYTNEVSSTALITETDLVLSINSATLMQAIIIGTPSISVNYNRRHEINVDFINDAVTEKVYSKSELECSLLNLDSLNERYLINRKRFMQDKLDNYEGNAASRIFS